MLAFGTLYQSPAAFPYSKTLILREEPNSQFTYGSASTAIIN
jgi:hypothetical protein